MADEILKEMIRQMRMQNIPQSMEFLKIDDNTLRVQQKVRSGMKKKRGFNIKYNKGTDLYDIDKFMVDLDFKSDNFGKAKWEKHEGVYADSLKEYF